LHSLCSAKEIQLPKIEPEENESQATAHEVITGWRQRSAQFPRATCGSRNREEDRWRSGPSPQWIPAAVCGSCSRPANTRPAQTPTAEMDTPASCKAVPHRASSETLAYPFLPLVFV